MITPARGGRHVLTAIATMAALAIIPHRADAQAPRVVINGVVLRQVDIQALALATGAPPVPGEYWYDRASGAWGPAGGPTAGFIAAGLPVGGTLAATASRGNTGVFINGRELHLLDVVGLRQLLGPVAPGRYWMDAWGNAGPEGGPPAVNLFQLYQARLAQSGTGGTGGAYSRYGPGGMFGNDGNGCLVFNDGEHSAAVGNC